MARKKTFEELKAYYERMANAYRKAETITADDDLITAIKKEYMHLSSIVATVEWIQENHPEAIRNKTQGRDFCANVLICESCGDADIDFAVRTIYEYNCAGAMRAWG